MPEPLSNTQLKTRLLGAGILVVLAVVVIPFFLGEPKYETEETEVPKSTQFESKIQPLPGSTPDNQELNEAQKQAVQGQGGLVLKKLDDSQPRKPLASGDNGNDIKIKPLDRQAESNNGEAPVTQRSVPPAQVPVVKAKPKAEPNPEIKTPAKPPAKPKPQLSKGEVTAGWVVQVGVFSKSENATSVATSLKSIGYAPKISDVNNQAGTKRVWIGPFANKSDAQKVSQQLKAKRGDGGFLKPYPF